jgi:hypothetical protein
MHHFHNEPNARVLNIGSRRHHLYLDCSQSTQKGAMRLLCPEADGSLSFVERYSKDIPPYAILSHVWGADFDEVTYDDLTEKRGGDKRGNQKLDFSRKQAARDG